MQEILKRILLVKSRNQKQIVLTFSLSLYLSCNEKLRKTASKLTCISPGIISGKNASSCCLEWASTTLVKALMTDRL